jgi:hypothetical protein
MDYEEGQPIPPGYTVRTEMRSGVVIGGGIVFWLGYGGSVALAWIGVRTQCELQGQLANCPGGLGYYPLNVPFAGPFIALKTLEPNPLESAGLVALGALQIAGIGILVTGLALPKKELVRTASAPSIKLVPGAVGSGLGLRVTGAL